MKALILFQYMRDAGAINGYAFHTWRATASGELAVEVPMHDDVFVRSSKLVTFDAHCSRFVDGVIGQLVEPP